MEGQREQPLSDPSAAVAVAAYPRWVMLEQGLEIQAEGSTSSASETLVAARTSTGHLIQVSLRLIEPPGVSCVCLHIPAGIDPNNSRVVAAHGDSVLIDVSHSGTTDHFVYSAGAAAADPPRPPSLSLLPPFGFDCPTGLVRRGEDVVVVAKLESVPALKFVNVFPRCCCGGAGASRCERSCHAYTIQTWTMRIGGDDMEWVMDGMVDSTELWSLDSYKALRRFPLGHPVVSLDQPELICFWLHETEDCYGRYNDNTVDLLMVNTRSKRIHSVSRSKNGLFQLRDGLIPSKVSCFFNSYVGSRGGRKEDVDRPPPVIVDEQMMREDDKGSKPTKLASFAGASVQVSEIFEAYQEISSYGLDRDDEIKVHRILSHDNCRRFISLLRLPKNLRMDWLLMEIKATED